MTNLEALRGSVNYPIADDKLTKALIDQAIEPTGTYAGITQPFEMALAAVYVLLVTSANISEGEYSVSSSDKALLMNLATAIFNKYGLPNPLSSSRVVNKSYYW